MTIDKLMYDWLKTEITDLVREGDKSTNLEPPIIKYMSGGFARRAEAGSAESWPNSQVRIRVEHQSSDAYNADAMDAAADTVIAALADEVPSLSGYVATPLSLAVEPPAVDTNAVTYRDIVFLTSISKGFAVAPITGGEGSVSIVGLAGTGLGFGSSTTATADYECTDESQTVETVGLSMPRCSGYIDWMLADSTTPLPVVGSTVSAVFAHTTDFAWVESIKIGSVTPRVVVRDQTEYQTARFGFHVDSAASPFFTGTTA